MSLPAPTIRSLALMAVNATAQRHRLSFVVDVLEGVRSNHPGPALPDHEGLEVVSVGIAERDGPAGLLIGIDLEALDLAIADVLDERRHGVRARHPRTVVTGLLRIRNVDAIKTDQLVADLEAVGVDNRLGGD